MKCSGCNYSIGKVIKGYCEICRSEYGFYNSKFSQKERAGVIDQPEEMTDGYFETVKIEDK